jgi:MSHA pilin protein MshD
MSSKRSLGFTLIEVLLAVVVIGGGVAGLMAVLTTTVKKSGDPLVTKQLLSIAEGMLEEIELKPYNDTSNDAPTVVCARNTYNSVLDYSGYTTTGKICNLEGAEVAALSGYSVSVAVESSALSGATAYKITVTASFGANKVSLVSWRTAYA